MKTERWKKCYKRCTISTSASKRSFDFKLCRSRSLKFKILEENSHALVNIFLADNQIFPLQ